MASSPPVNLTKSSNGGGLYASCRRTLSSSSSGSGSGSASAPPSPIYYSLHALDDSRVWKLPYSIRVLLESGTYLSSHQGWFCELWLLQHALARTQLSDTALLEYGAMQHMTCTRSILSVQPELWLFVACLLKIIRTCVILSTAQSFVVSWTGMACSVIGGGAAAWTTRLCFACLYYIYAVVPLWCMQLHTIQKTLTSHHHNNTHTQKKKNQTKHSHMCLI